MPKGMKVGIYKTDICERCGNAFSAIGNGRKLCDKCNDEMTTFICKNCGTVFHIDYPKKEVRKFCSLKCAAVYTGIAKRMTPKICKQCGKPYRSTGTKRKFCSLKCHADSMRLPPKVCPNCGKTFLYITGKTCCSKECASAYPGSNYAINIKRRNGRRTDIEKIVEGFLIESHVSYEFEYPVGTRSVDYAIPIRKIAIECDGAAWHFDPVSDERKNEYLKSMGWSVIRLSEDVIRSGTFRNLLIDFLGMQSEMF